MLQEFKTQTIITLILEKMGKPEEEVIDAHGKAIQMATMMGNLNKEVTARFNFSVYLKSVNRITEAGKIFNI